jgi:hypothetical protein
MMWNDALAVAGRRYPKAIERGVFANDGDQPILRARVDNRRTREFFGVDFLGFEGQVGEVLDHYLELKGEPIE